MIKRDLTGQDKKDLARALYITGKHTRKEIANNVGCAEKTLRDWIDKFSWNDLKEAKTVTRHQLLTEEYKQLQRINEAISENEDGCPTKQQSDAKAVIAKNIERLSDAPLHRYVEVFEDFTNHILEKHPRLAKEYSNIMYEFLELRAN